MRARALRRSGNMSTCILIFCICFIHVCVHSLIKLRRRPQESIFTTSRRRTDDAVFNQASTESNTKDAVTKAHVHRIRREMAARIRIVNSLTSRSNHERADQGELMGGEAILSESHHEPDVEIPRIQTRHPDEGALLAACNDTMAAIQVHIKHAQEALDSADVFTLWAAYQELCLSQALWQRARARSRRAALQHLGMRVGSRGHSVSLHVLAYFHMPHAHHQDLHELLLTFLFRCNSWFCSHLSMRTTFCNTNAHIAFHLAS